MATPARWIRLEAEDARGLRGVCEGFARAQSARSAPAVLWARETGLALVAPMKFVPGRPQRWRSWGLSPLAAAFRQEGLRAYLEDDGNIWASGRRLAWSEAWAAGACVVVVAYFAAPAREFLERLRERIESQHGWQFDHCWPSSAEKEAMLEQVGAH